LPDRVTVCGLVFALSVMVSVPVLVPVAVGVKVIPIVQPPPAGTPDPHVLLLTAKSPLAAMVAIVSGAPWLFVSVTVSGALVVPTF